MRESRRRLLSGIQLKEDAGSQLLEEATVSRLSG